MRSPKLSGILRKDTPWEKSSLLCEWWFSFLAGQVEAEENHSALREKLQSKGYTIVDEFGCVGFNTNSFLKRFGGINKGRPNAEDLKNAEEFARGLRQNL